MWWESTGYKLCRSAVLLKDIPKSRYLDSSIARCSASRNLSSFPTECRFCSIGATQGELNPFNNCILNKCSACVISIIATSMRRRKRPCRCHIRTFIFSFLFTSCVMRRYIECSEGYYCIQVVGTFNRWW